MAQIIKNPFIHRWKLDDPQWMKQRKEQWNGVRRNNEHASAKALKEIKDLFLFGIIRRDRNESYYPAGTLTTWEFPFVPCETIEEVIEVMESLWVVNDYYTGLNAVAFGFECALDNPFGCLGGREELFAKALFPGEYREESVFLPYGRETREYKKYIPAEKFVPEFERQAYRFLTETHSSPYNPVQYILEHYLSCIRHLEGASQPVPHHAWLPNLLSCVFNIVEPRAPWGDESNVARFARCFAERLQQPDIPKSLRAGIDALGPNRLCEYSRINPPKDVPNYLTSEWQAPEIRVLHNVTPEVALQIVFSSAKRTGLLPEAFRPPTPVPVNIAPLLSDDFIVKKLERPLNAAVPAHRITVWFDPRVRFSNHNVTGHSRPS